MNSASGGAVVAKRFNPREAVLELNRKDLGQFGKCLATAVEIATNQQPETPSVFACNLHLREKLILVYQQPRPLIALNNFAPS